MQFAFTKKTYGMCTLVCGGGMNMYDEENNGNACAFVWVWMTCVHVLVYIWRWRCRGKNVLFVHGHDTHVICSKDTSTCDRIKLLINRWQVWLRFVYWSIIMNVFCMSCHWHRWWCELVWVIMRTDDVFKRSCLNNNVICLLFMRLSLHHCMCSAVFKNMIELAIKFVCSFEKTDFFFQWNYINVSNQWICSNWMVSY